jgi:hypothetical protein
MFGPISLFLVLLIINFFLSYMENNIFGEISYSVKELLNRHKYLLRSTNEKFRGSNVGTSNTNDDLNQFGRQKTYPIYK